MSTIVAGGCGVALNIDDLGQKNYPPADLFARRPRCDSSQMALLCSCCRALKTNENATRSGNFVSVNRLTHGGLTDGTLARRNPMIRFDIDDLWQADGGWWQRWK